MRKPSIFNVYVCSLLHCSRITVRGLIILVSITFSPSFAIADEVADRAKLLLLDTLRSEVCMRINNYYTQVRMNELRDPSLKSQIVIPKAAVRGSDLVFEYSNSIDGEICGATYFIDMADGVRITSSVRRLKEAIRDVFYDIRINVSFLAGEIYAYYLDHRASAGITISYRLSIGSVVDRFVILYLNAVSQEEFSKFSIEEKNSVFFTTLVARAPKIYAMEHYPNTFVSYKHFIEK